ncbi:uncharacterized protein LOC112589874 [Harpegnathos saltator]|uniref:Uncharacterized protein n=1 Tax=Harpegnathos saltator TaxID=610380 RepID=E2BB65_HARSA|nr:uncharacterized protein LOC112589874 [Harpegnathos saltator]EFN87065.1 hypothetical protein EAI_00598 [Harpegnathos saltator]
MANTNANAEFKKIAYGDSGKARYESYMLLSTTYPLNTSHTKRMQIGLRASNDGTTFEPTIKLSGNTSTGIQFNFATWEKFKEYMKYIGDYLHSVTRAVPEPVHINDVTITFITAYGARAIMVTENTKTAEVNTASKRMPTDSSQGQQPPTKKRKVCTVLRPVERMQLDACFHKLRRTRKSAVQIKDRNDPFIWRGRTSVVLYLGQGTEFFYLG